MNRSMPAQVKAVVVTIVGAIQGNIGNGRILPEKYQFQPGQPLDAATGLPSGRAINGPVTFSKRWDASSALLLNALSNNENLTSVKFEFESATGVLYTVQLTNASIVSIDQTFDEASGVPMEDIHLRYQTLSFQDNTTTPPHVAVFSNNRVNK